MKKSIIIKLSFPSNMPNTQERQYFIDDKEVSELAYYDLEHLENSDVQDLQIALSEERKNVPADIRKFLDWQVRCSLIEELITKKVGHRFWADFID